MRIKNRIQAVGNSGLCGDISKTTEKDLKNTRSMKRLIATLLYTKTNNGTTREKYKVEIPKFLYKNYGVKSNKSNIMHWLRKPLLWMFLELSASNYFRITLAGQKCLDILTSDAPNKKDLLIELLLDQGTRVHYPNPAANRVSDEVSVLLFRLLFCLLLKHEKLTYNDLTCVFPYITNSDFLNANYELDFMNLGNLGECYTKLLEWDIADFINLGVILVHKNSDGKYYTINPEYIDLVKRYYGMYTDIDMFFVSGAKHLLDIRNTTKEARDSTLAKIVKQRDKFTDVLTGQTADWDAEKGEPGCVVHHIIPFNRKAHYQKEYNVNIDSPEYCVTVSYETHGRIHSGLFEFKEALITKMHNFLSEEAKNKIGLTKEKLFNEYMGH